jgi:transposase
MVYQQTRRWIAANVFEEMAHDLRQLLRKAQGRNAQPSATIFDSRTLQSTIESGERAGYNGDKKKNGSKTHAAVDTLGHLLALSVTPANEQDRVPSGWQVGMLAKQVQEATGESVTLAYVDQAYTGEETATAAEEEGMNLSVVKLEEAKKGFVLLPRRWVVERSFAWASRFRRLARDYERVADVLAGYHGVVSAILMLVKAQNGLPLWKTSP